jgi:hypothetical protein
MLHINPKKRTTLCGIIRDRWVNYQCSSYPVDYQDAEQQSLVIPQSWVEMMYATPLKVAGNLLYEDVKTKTEVKTSEQETATDEDSNEEQDADKVISRMTVKDHKGVKIWWKRMWNQISRAIIGKETTNPNQVQSMRISFRDLLPTSRIEHHPAAESTNHTRISTESGPVNYPAPEKNHKRYRFWGSGRR